jgi:type IV secretion system protein TrbL
MDDVARARVNFRPQGGRYWYFVEMKREEGAFVAVLPKPKKDLRRMEYYLDATGRQFGEARTAEFASTVVPSAGMCGTMRSTASMAASVTSILLGIPAGAPAIPAGFSAAGVVAAAGSAGAAGAGAAGASGGGGGISTTAVVVGGVVAAGAAVAVVARGGDDEGSSSINFFIEGHVYRNPASACNSGSSCFPTSAPGAAAGPHPSSCGPIVAGATVSNSISAATATTDAQGYFYLDTGVKETGCQNPSSVSQAVTVSAAGCQTATVSPPPGCHGGQATSCLVHVPLRCP